jgi:hypothetical protein
MRVVVSVLHLQKEHEEGHTLVYHLWKNRTQCTVVGIIDNSFGIAEFRTPLVT